MKDLTSPAGTGMNVGDSVVGTAVPAVVGNAVGTAAFDGLVAGALVVCTVESGGGDG